MEVTQRLIAMVVAVSLFLGSSSGDILVQPGYTQPNENQAPETTLEEEFHRYQTLQRLVENQIEQLMKQEHYDSSAVGLYPYRPLLPHINHGKLFSLNPSGIHGLHLGGYGIHRPLLLREATEEPVQPNFVGRSHWTRSVRDESGRDAGSKTDVYDVASQPSLKNDNVQGVVDILTSQISPAEDSTDKLVEPRQIGPFTQAFLGSPLDRIHYDLPQYHPLDSPEMPSRVMNVAHTVGKMIDTVASGVRDSRVNPDNKDPTSHHQNPVGNYHQYPQYHQPSHEEQRSEAPSNWNPVGTGSDNQATAGESYNNEQRQGWSKMAQDQSSQTSSPKVGSHQYSQQASASYPIGNNAANNKNWLTATKQFFNGLPGYQNYQQPGYPNYFGRPPQYNNFGPSFPSSATSSASAIASSSANSNNMGYPYAPSYKSPYASYNPYGVTGIIDQFGRSISSIVAQPQYAGAYVNNLVNYPGLYKPAGYY